MGKARYAWVTLLPMCFVATTTLTAGFLSVRDNYWPMAIGPDPTKNFPGYVNSICTVTMMICAVIVLTSTVLRWRLVLSGRVPTRLEPVEV